MTAARPIASVVITFASGESVVVENPERYTLNIKRDMRASSLDGVTIERELTGLEDVRLTLHLDKSNGGRIEWRSAPRRVLGTPRPVMTNAIAGPVTATSTWRSRE